MAAPACACRGPGRSWVAQCPTTSSCWSPGSSSWCRSSSRSSGPSRPRRTSSPTRRACCPCRSNGGRQRRGAAAVHRAAAGRRHGQLARVENGTSLREFIGVDDAPVVLVAPRDAMTPPDTVVVDGEEKDVYTAESAARRPGVRQQVAHRRHLRRSRRPVGATGLRRLVRRRPRRGGRVPDGQLLQVLELEGFGRSLTNTVL